MLVILQTENFTKWLNTIQDTRLLSAIDARIVRMQAGNFGDCEAIGGGLSEARIHYGAGYRLYFRRTEAIVYVLLCGGSKRTQKKDIILARNLADAL